MNKFLRAVEEFDIAAVKEFVENPRWRNWSCKDGKNALHFLCGVWFHNNPEKAKRSLQILKLLLKSGLDINSIHKIPERNGYFHGTPLWYGAVMKMSAPTSKGRQGV